MVFPNIFAKRKQDELNTELLKLYNKEQILSKTIESIDMFFDKKFSGLADIYKVVPVKPLQGFFPETILETNHYQNIIARFEQIKNNLPKDKGIIIVERGWNTDEQYTAETNQDAIIIHKNLNINEQVIDFLRPNWYINNIAIIEEELKTIENEFTIENNRKTFFSSNSTYKTTSETNMQNISVEPKGTDEKLLQLFALKRIQWLHNNTDLTAHYTKTEKELETDLEKQILKTYQSRELDSISSNQGLGQPEKMIDEKDTYYEAKNFFILNKILDGLNTVTKNYQI